MKKVLLADRLPERCAAMLSGAGFEVQDRPGLSPEELKDALRGVHGVICRSGAKLTADVLEGADVLEAICRAGVGVDNIDVEAASRKGVVVMNTPGGNTISTAEHAFALMLALARKIVPAASAMREGRWEKKKYGGSQLAGATLGVIGLGRIGQAVARRALAFDMDVLAYDPYVGRDAASKVGVTLVDDLGELLGRCDYLTVHVPETEQTHAMIGPERIARMKQGACIVNCARGCVVDQQAAVTAVEEGRLGGAAFDVYVKEPPDDYEFARREEVVATPHLAASTDAAQMAVAVSAAEQLIEALQHHNFRNAINVSALPPEEMQAIQPYCDLAVRLGRLVAQLNPGRPEAIAVACRGGVAQDTIEPMVNYGAMGVMQASLGPGVNVISAPLLAADRGIHITSSSTVGGEAGFTDLVEVRLTTDEGEAAAAGTLFGRAHPRIVRIDEFYVEIMPEGHVLVVFGDDVPGLIGKVGLCLGDGGVNIARMGFGRRDAGGRALIALNLDAACDGATLERIRNLDDVHRVVPVEL